MVAEASPKCGESSDDWFGPLLACPTVIHGGLLAAERASSYTFTTGDV